MGKGDSPIVIGSTYYKGSKDSLYREIMAAEKQESAQEPEQEPETIPESKRRLLKSHRADRADRADRAAILGGELRVVEERGEGKSSNSGRGSPITKSTFEGYSSQQPIVKEPYSSNTYTTSQRQSPLFASQGESGLLPEDGPSLRDELRAAERPCHLRVSSRVPRKVIGVPYVDVKAELLAAAQREEAEHLGNMLGEQSGANKSSPPPIDVRAQGPNHTR